MKSIDSINGHPAKTMALMIFVISLGFFNDLFFIASDNYKEWLVYDYGFRIVELAIVFSYPPFREVVKRVFRGAGLTLNGILGAVFCASVILSFDFLLSPIFYNLLGGENAVLFKYPEIEHLGLKVIDMMFGLVLVSVSEEIIHRGLFAAWIVRYTSSPAVIVIVSSVIFALIHWSHGPDNVITAFIAGILLMALYLQTRSLLPPMLAHYIVNFIFFI